MTSHAAMDGIASYNNMMPLSSPNPSDPPCRLLELAAELRNRIYEYALIEEDTITFSKSKTAQPGLLRTCRQIHEETRAMYYCCNKFEIVHSQYDVQVARLFYKQAEGFWDNYETKYPLGVVLYQVSYARPKWDKALLWLQAYHADEVTRYVCSCDKMRGRRGCCRFEKAFEVIDCVYDLSWENVKALLKAYRKAVQDETGKAW